MNAVDIVKEISKRDGYKGYYVKGYDDFAYVVTPSDNVLTVNIGTFWGFHVTFDYIPSHATGSGCSCQDEDISAEYLLSHIKELEEEGRKFANKLGAKRYADSSEWYKKNYWNGRGLTEVR